MDQDQEIQFERYFNLAIACVSHGDYSSANKHYASAISLGESLVDNYFSAKQEWPLGLLNNLASVNFNRGIFLDSVGDSEGARMAYSSAVAIGEFLRKIYTADEQVWPPDLQSNLINAYFNQGNLLRYLCEGEDARVAYASAIATGEGLRESYSSTGQAWLLELHINLAKIYNNQGVLLDTLGDSEGASASYTSAITIHEYLRESYVAAEQLWPPELQNNLAGVYVNQGALLDILDDSEGASVAFASAISIREGLRESYAEAEQVWPQELQNNLAKTYTNQGLLLVTLGDNSGASVAYASAITVQEGLRESYVGAGQAWPLELQNNLATTYINQGKLLMLLGDSDGSRVAYASSIKIHEGLRENYAVAEQIWPPVLQHDLMVLYSNYGILLKY